MGRIASVNGFVYCPFCGAKLDKEEIPVGKYRTNLKVSCEKHGELYIIP